MQIGSGASPLTLAVLKTLGNQANLGATAGASPASGTSGAIVGAASGGVSSAVSNSGGAAQNAPAEPPEPGKVFPRGSFVDLKA